MNKPTIKQYVGRTFSVLAMVGVLLALPGAQAATPIAASGTFYTCRDVSDVSTVGNITILTSSISVTLTGTLSGTVVGTEQLVSYPNGDLSASISGTFSGTVAGQAGTAQISGTGTLTPGNGTGVLYWVIGQGTLGLAGLHGQGSFEHPSFGPPTEQCPGGTVTGDYSAQLQFAE
jgi:hypothetical protein